MATYGGYIDGMGVTKAFVERGKLEEVEESRLGVGYGYVGYEDGTFKKGGR